MGNDEKCNIDCNVIDFIVKQFVMTKIYKRNLFAGKIVKYMEVRKVACSFAPLNWKLSFEFISIQVLMFKTEFQIGTRVHLFPLFD